MKQVVVRLQGGLGNQLFQVAAGRAFHPHPLFVTYGERWAPGHPDVTSFGFPTVYPNRYLRTTVPGVAVRETWRDSISFGCSKIVGWSRGVTQVIQTDPFASRPMDLCPPMSLQGWFQHSSWWENSWAEVAVQLAKSAPASLSDFSETSPVVVKLRMSDYHDDGWVLDRGYFASAFELLGIADRQVIVVSEDGGARQWLGPLLKRTRCEVVDGPRFTGDRNLDDFWAIAGASVIVQANSSFSWWAAALASWLRPGVQVAYPSPWLPNRWSSGTVPDMGLDSWHEVATNLD